jgi:hypothetical protein
VRHCPAAIDLLGGARHLLWLVAAVASERKTAWQEVSDVLARPRREVLEWCGGINSKSAVKFLEKRSGEEWIPYLLDELRREVADPAVLAAATKVERPDGYTAVMARRMAMQPELKQYRCLDPALPHEGPGKTPLRLMEDVRRMCGLVPGADAEGMLKACRDPHELTALHDRLLKQLLDSDPKRYYRAFPGRLTRFRRPPIAGSATIVPLRSSEELRLEGQEMHHCCGAYVALVRRGISYLYKVLEPERATLELFTGDREPLIAQLALRQNREPSEATWRAVRAWLRQGLVEFRQRKARALERKQARAARKGH